MSTIMSTTNTSKKHNILLLDIRNHDEIDTIKYNLTNNIITDILYIPSNIIKYNIEFLNEHFTKYNKIYIICKSGSRSKSIKEKYFSQNPDILVNPQHFNNLDDKYILHTPGLYLSITRKIQIISGSIILLLFLLLLYYENVKYIFPLFALFMIYVGVSGNCFMSSILTKNDI